MTEKTKMKFRNIGLRLSLFRIWLWKNSLLFLKILLFIIFMLMISGNVTSETPVLGKIVYPLFAPLLDSINDAIKTSNAGTFLDIVITLLSILFALTLFMTRLKTIVIDDIKSKKLKIALIQAGLYFDKNGKLTRRPKDISDEELENVADMDLRREGIFSGIKRAGSELKVVLTAKIESPAEYKKAEEQILESPSSEYISENQITETERIDENMETINEEENKVITCDENCPCKIEEKDSIKEKIKKLLDSISKFFDRIGKAIVNLFKKKESKEKAEEETTTEQTEITDKDCIVIEENVNTTNSETPIDASSEVVTLPEPAADNTVKIDETVVAQSVQTTAAVAQISAEKSNVQIKASIGFTTTSQNDFIARLKEKSKGKK